MKNLSLINLLEDNISIMNLDLIIGIIQIVLINNTKTTNCINSAKCISDTNCIHNTNCINNTQIVFVLSGNCNNSSQNAFKNI